MKAWIAACVFCLLASPVAAAELTKEQAHYVYMMAHAESGLPLPDKAPEIHVVSLEMLQAIVCPGEKCRMEGVAVDGRIYMRDDLDFSKPRSLLILLHEMVHHLQYMARGGKAKDCAEWMDREHQAFAVELRATQKAGLETHSTVVAMGMLRCR